MVMLTLASFFNGNLVTYIIEIITYIIEHDNLVTFFKVVIL
jgi:hypothetical protein